MVFTVQNVQVESDGVHRESVKHDRSLSGVRLQVVPRPVVRGQRIDLGKARGLARGNHEELGPKTLVHPSEVSMSPPEI